MILHQKHRETIFLRNYKEVQLLVSGPSSAMCNQVWPLQGLLNCGAQQPLQSTILECPYAKIQPSKGVLYQVSDHFGLTTEFLCGVDGESRQSSQMGT
jgi:hypothetical protein